MGDFPPNASLFDNPSVGTAKGLFEDWLDATKELFSGSAETAVHASGVITVSKSIVGISGSGSYNITDIQTTELQPGRSLILVHSAAGFPTLVHDAAKIVLRGGSSHAMGNNGFVILFQKTANVWYEVSRFERTANDLSTFLNLGTAAYFNVGSGNNLDADKLDGNEATAFLGATGTAVRATALDDTDDGDLDSKDFVQIAGSTSGDAAQAVGGVFQTGPALTIANSIVGLAALYLSINSNVRWSVTHDDDDIDDNAVIETATGTRVWRATNKDTTNVGRLKLKQGSTHGVDAGLFYSNDDQSMPTDQSLVPGPGNKLDADTVDGLEGRDAGSATADVNTGLSLAYFDAIGWYILAKVPILGFDGLTDYVVTGRCECTQAWSADSWGLMAGAAGTGGETWLIGPITGASIAQELQDGYRWTVPSSGQNYVYFAFYKATTGGNDVVFGNNWIRCERAQS